MNDLLFLIPLILGFGIVALGMKQNIFKGTAMNRPAFGITLIIGSLFFWLSSAILLSYEREVYFTLSMLPVLVFFLGLAFFFPQPPGMTRPSHHGLPGSILIWLGIALGLVHSLTLMFSEAWPNWLIQFYGAIGLHGSSQAMP